MWARACSRKRCVSQHIHPLTAAFESKPAHIPNGIPIQASGQFRGRSVRLFQQHGEAYKRVDRTFFHGGFFFGA